MPVKTLQVLHLSLAELDPSSEQECLANSASLSCALSPSGCSCAGGITATGILPPCHGAHRSHTARSPGHQPGGRGSPSKTLSP